LSTNVIQLPSGQIVTLNEQMATKQDTLTNPVCASNAITYNIATATSGTSYAMFTASNYVPSGKNFIGVMLTNSPSGNYDVDGGNIKYRGSGVVYYTPTTSQPGINVVCRVLYC